MQPQVLFVCVHNAGRSQIAAALLEHYAMGRIQVRLVRENRPVHADASVRVRQLIATDQVLSGFYWI